MKPYRLIAFKKDGYAHRLWQRLNLVSETADLYVFIAFYPSITEGSGRTWSNEEPTIYFCHKKKFFNILVMFKKTGGLSYYVNIASPTMKIDEYTYGFIDLDLDVKLLPTKEIVLLDEEEFKHNTEVYGYDESLVEVCLKTVEHIKELMNNKDVLFDDESNQKILDSYRKKRVEK